MFMDTKPSQQYDFVIIGAGIIGLSLAWSLIQRYPRAKIAVIEKEPQIGLHASGRNSGVLHSGIYYGQDSLKAKVCADGAQRMLAFADEHHIPYRKTGKVIIATQPDELPALQVLLQNAAHNGIRAERLDADAIREIEPDANPYQAGIYTPDTASIDNKAVLKKLQALILNAGVQLHLGQKVMTASPAKKTLTTPQTTYHYGYLFNCAGAGTDTIAKLFGCAANYRLLPFKGIYYKLSKTAAARVKGHIYPVPDLHLPFLGVHISRNMNGEVYVGPTATPAFGRENYGLIHGISWEAPRIMTDIACMYVANQQNFRLLMHTEIRKYFKSHFVRAARKLMPMLAATDFLPANKVGIRPQLINIAERKIVMDYIIEQQNDAMHVLNAISPAFTGAFAFAEMLLTRL